MTISTRCRVSRDALGAYLAIGWCQVYAGRRDVVIEWIGSVARYPVYPVSARLPDGAEQRVEDESARRIAALELGSSSYYRTRTGGRR